MLERDELDASNELECAKIENESANGMLQVVQELAMEMAAVCLDAEERIANAPMRERVAAEAVAAWGPDHAARPPTAVYDLRSPLQPVPPPEQHANGSWNGGRIPVGTAKQA